MIITEEEAKTKRCQESYGPAPQPATACNAPAPMMMSGGISYTTGGGFYPSSPLNCVGSECMAWRWERDEFGEPIEHIADGMRGYCGKAGHP